MKTLLKKAKVVNVFTDEIEVADVLFDEDRILGVGTYDDEEADVCIELNGNYVCPGFIDGHIHIESTMLMPVEFAKQCVSHGTTAVAADPHEIANVCGTLGIEYMLEASEDLPMDLFITLPSCVPCSPFEENGAFLTAEQLSPFYQHPRVIGLGEMMDYTGVISKEQLIRDKIQDAHKHKKIVNGHAPLLSGKDLDAYISARIQDDHECSDVSEAKEKIRKGQWVMIRQGTAARNLEDLLPLFEEPWSRRCLFVTDDKQPSDFINDGHIDGIIREAVQSGCSVITAIRMATIQAAQCLALPYTGAIAPGYVSNFLILEDLEKVQIKSVYFRGKRVFDKQEATWNFKTKELLKQEKYKPLLQSFHVKKLTKVDFRIEEQKNPCRVMELVKNQLITKEIKVNIDFTKSGSVSVEQDILKLAVIERHRNTGHIGLGFIRGFGMKEGAIAASVSHDAHNLIVLGTNEDDMVLAANKVSELGGGCVVVTRGTVLVVLPLPIAGLMSDLEAIEVASRQLELREAAYGLGITREIDPFMTLAFVSLPVIPDLKLTSRGLVDVTVQQLVPLSSEF